MRIINQIMILAISLLNALAVNAAELKTVRLGDAQVLYQLQPLEEGTATLTLTALVYENNDSLRGLKNQDPRRLSKLGQLAYQCKLLLHKPLQGSQVIDSKDPVLVSKNFTLFTDVNMTLQASEQVGIQMQLLKLPGADSLFTASLGRTEYNPVINSFVGGERPVKLQRLDLDGLSSEKLLESAEALNIDLRFPAFQLHKPARQWNYSFALADFKRAVQHTEQNCSADKFREILNSNP